MTKSPITQELKQEFAKGNLKPSQLKRRKSASDIPASLSPNPPLQKSKSSEDILPEPSELKQQITSLQDELTIERQRVSSLREDLAANQEKLKAKTKTIQELQDQSLELRLKNLQDFEEYYTEKQALNNELEENISQGTKEIERLEKQLLALNKKKLTLQSQLQQSELKNTQLELKAIGEKEPYSALNFPWIIMLSLSLVIVWKIGGNDD